MNIIEWFQKHDTLNLTVARVEFVSGVAAPGGRGEGKSLIWSIRGCAAGQGMVYALSILKTGYKILSQSTSVLIRIIMNRVLPARLI